MTDERLRGGGDDLEVDPDDAGDPWERFIGGPGDGVVYGPDGKPWKPGDPIPPRPPRRASQDGGERDPGSDTS